MKALTLHQPWASLVALGVKTIETRSWSTKYRGPLAIHATTSVGVSLIRGASLPVGEFTITNDTPRRSSPQYLLRGPVKWPYRVPLGAVVATCELVDVVPMEGPDDDGCPALVVEGWQLTLCNESGEHDVTAQRPYGDFTPGRFAWLLADIKPLTEPIPAKGRQGLWNWEAA